MTDAIEVTLEPGEVLYHEGSNSDFAYVVDHGDLILYSHATGQRIDCEKRRAGAIIGELSILTGKPRTVTVEALTPCRLFRISAHQILRRFDRLDPVLRACIDTSINFSTTLSNQLNGKAGTVPIAPSTLRNAPQLTERLRLEQDILSGLKRNEFSLMYQPIVRLSDGGLVGLEALMRWYHPQLGAVPPFRFIEIAEAMGSINRLTNFALMEACAFLKRVDTLGPGARDVYVSVNISGKDIEQTLFADYLAHILDTHEIDPARLKLELTETALVGNPDKAVDQLGRIRALGCGIAIDDFGTGYSNLAYLKKLPFTTLKIDRAFAGDAYANEVSRSIVKMLLGLGRELQVDIIAEGLETQGDVETLRALGCPHAQGYHFSKPKSEADIIAMLADTCAPAQRAEQVA